MRGRSAVPEMPPRMTPAREAAWRHLSDLDAFTKSNPTLAKAITHRRMTEAGFDERTILQATNFAMTAGTGPSRHDRR